MADSLKTYEKKYKALEEIVQSLDREDLSVNEMLTRYKKGLSLVKDCADILNTTEDEVKQLIEEVRITDLRG